jgi:basic membrane protein A and related proteins
MTPPLFGLAAIALALGAAPAAAQQKLKIGFIYVGPVGDHGWTYQHDVGRKAIEKEFGGRVETTFVESVPEADSERAIEGLARTGHGLIFTTSFGFMEPTLKVARRYPNVKFEHATGIKRAPNLATYAAKFHEGRYIIGQIAGKMTKTGTIGYVGAFPIPEVVAGINAYFLGAQSVNPNVKIKVVWVNSWYDPAKEADAAKALLDQGVDYVARAKAALEGTWKSEDTWYGLKEGMVVMAPYKNMPDDVKKLAQETEEAIRSGRLNPFKCPIAKQDGAAVECKGGAALSDEQILSMNFYVKGIDDKLPQ